MRVVLATDGSRHAERAAQWAVAFATRLGDVDVTLVNVGHIPAAPITGPGVHGVVEFRVVTESLERAGAEILARTAELFKGKAVEIRSTYRTGDPAHEVLKVAEEAHADLIVLGRRGLGRIGGLILGSVSERILHGAHCPVVVVQ
ncbi:MAG TPA: universal stress protein [bacterium]|nr:universal stress protein [bacterium]